MSPNHTLSDMGVPRPDHELGYRWSYLKDHLGVEEAEALSRWLVGQTCSVDSASGELVFYSCDIERGLNFLRRGVSNDEGN